MDLNQFLLALRARRKAFMLALVATIVAALAVALIMPKKYVGQATLIVDSRDEQTIAPAHGGVSLATRAAYVATQIELIQSGRVATQVARDLNLVENAELREMWQDDTGGVGAIDVWIGELLLTKLKVTNTASNLITIEYSTKSPKAAAQIANGFAKAYLDVVLELRNQPVREASKWFEEQLGGMRNQVTQAENKLTAFQKQKGILVADEHLDIETARLTELNTQMLAARVAFYDAESKYKQASELLASGGSPDAMADVMASPAVAAVKLDLARAESLLQTASTDLGANHPVYMKYSADVKALREKLASEMKKVVATLRNAMDGAQKREQEIKTAVDAHHAGEGRARPARLDDARSRERAAQLRHGAHPRHEHAAREPRQAGRCAAAHAGDRAGAAGAAQDPAGRGALGGARPAHRHRHEIRRASCRPARALAHRPRGAPGGALARPPLQVAADRRP